MFYPQSDLTHSEIKDILIALGVPEDNFIFVKLPATHIVQYVSPSLIYEGFELTEKVSVDINSHALIVSSWLFTEEVIDMLKNSKYKWAIYSLYTTSNESPFTYVIRMAYGEPFKNARINLKHKNLKLVTRMYI
jgi:hypothetical protein